MRTWMSERELKRAAVFGRVAEKAWTLVQAAERMGVSYRQGKRLWKRYRAQGLAGLVHGNVGRASNRAKPKQLRRRVLKLVREKYSGAVGQRFGPTLAAEHLAQEDGIELGVETLRGWMLEEGLWSGERRGRAHRQRRERKAHFGELVQMDGSFHDWLEERGPRGCLMNMVDDATGTTRCRMGEEETIWAAVGVLKGWIGRYGIPQALYTDWKNVYVREPNAGERQRGEAPVTQFGRMCQRLGIQIIAARSPQAKGRVERNHGTHQDRLVKKLRRKKIKTYAAANEFLKKEYLPEHNQRFRHVAAAEQDYHRPAPKPKELDEIFRLETERVIGNDWVVRYENRYLQVQTSGRRQAPAKAKVVVCEWEDGRLEIRYRGQKLQWEELADKPEPRRETSAEKKSKPYGGTPPTAQHPWKQSYQEMKVWNSPAKKAARV